VPWLLRTFKKLSNQNYLQDKEGNSNSDSFLPHSHLHLAGGGSGLEKDECLELANELDKVTVHGALSHEELASLMKKSHLFILPSFFEGLPLVLMEALACGCRVITTSLPGTCEVLGSCDSTLLASSDSGISGNSNNNMVTLVELPKLETVDKPYIRDLEELETRLCEHIINSIKDLLKNPEPNQKQIKILTQNYTWSRVFKRIESVYNIEYTSFRRLLSS
jgi:glycosyltransferase involved in cell wall biosynthesis